MISSVCLDSLFGGMFPFFEKKSIFPEKKTDMRGRAAHLPLMSSEALSTVCLGLFLDAFPHEGEIIGDAQDA